MKNYQTHGNLGGYLISKTFEENRRLLTDLENRVQERTHALKTALSNLEDSKNQVIAQEKLASLGTVVAGIAHEIKNPLNFVINFARISQDLLKELQKNASGEEDPKHLMAIHDNLAKIVEYADRADYIIQSMLLHARSSPSSLEETDLNRFVKEYADLCYQSFSAQHQDIPLKFENNLDPNLFPVRVYVQDLGRVLLNLLNNAFDAVLERYHQENHLGYQPSVLVKTQDTQDFAMIMVSDNGFGIPPDLLKKIFDPFFTTKSPGQGTGLGLSISHDCIQRHKGSLEVESRQGEGTWFFVRIPKNLTTQTIQQS